MKLSSAFDSMMSENRFLKFLSKVQLLTTIFIVGLLYSFYDRPPVLVERSGHGLEIVQPAEFERTPTELKTAIGLMMRARFSSKTFSPELFINPKQVALRETEQKDMLARGMDQVIVVRDVKLEKDQAVVDFDRVISIGEIRSALKTKVRVTFEEVMPNDLNPYGLLLSLADPIIDKEVKE